ncbi:MAG: hypothetical protein DMF27_00500 [Verrucomicrobia bacterium]|nr:MAG: hypothetical protein DMF27_00500 [Verrucomicrobiota bacterium]
MACQSPRGAWANFKKRAKCLYPLRYWPRKRRGNSPKEPRPGGLKIARRLRCVSVTGRKGHAPSSRLGGGHFELNDWVSRTGYTTLNDGLLRVFQQELA